MKGRIWIDPNEPADEYTEWIRCDDCGEDTSHHVQIWPVGGSTKECGECRVVTDYTGEK